MSELTPKQMDLANHLHPFTDFKAYRESGGRIYSRAEDIYILDEAGKKILDGMSGLWCVNLGYSQQKIIQAITEQLQRLPFYNSSFNCSNDAAAAMAAAALGCGRPDATDRLAALVEELAGQRSQP